MNPDVPSGLLVLDKPSGVTSFHCVHRVKKILQNVKVGHCGTLDPMAQGVLLVLTGRSTRLQDRFMGLEKHYWFRAEFGRATDTGDREGKPIAEAPYDHLTTEALQEGLGRQLGEQMQI